MLYETERLLVRQWEAKDAQALFGYACDPEVTRMLRFPTYKTVKEAESRIADMRANYDMSSGGLCSETDWAVQLKETGAVIGAIGVTETFDSATGTVELGYVMNRLYQGRGYMTEAVVGMLCYIKENPRQGDVQVKKVIAKYAVNNPASGRVMEKAGMALREVRKDGTWNNESGGCPIDCVVYEVRV